MPKGIFPHMNIPDIITSLGGWGLSVSSDQLTHPTADFIEGVYCACLQQVTGLTYGSLRDPVASSISSLALDNEVRPFCIVHLSQFRDILGILGSVFFCVLQQPNFVPFVRFNIALRISRSNAQLELAFQKPHKSRTSVLRPYTRLKKPEL